MLPRLRSSLSNDNGFHYYSKQEMKFKYGNGFVNKYRGFEDRGQNYNNYLGT